MISPEERRRRVKMRNRIRKKRRKAFRRRVFLIFVLLFIGLIFKVLIVDKFLKSNKKNLDKLFNAIHLFSPSQNRPDKEGLVIEGKSLLVNPHQNPAGFDSESIDDISYLPEKIQSKIVNYPETYSTMIRFKEYREGKIDISENLRASNDNPIRKNFPYFSQWDEKWAFKPVADNYFANVACGPTVMTSIYIGFTGDEDMNPIKMADFAAKNLWFDQEGTNIDFFTEGAEKLGLEGNFVESDIEVIKENLDRGKVLVCIVGEGDFTRSSHYIVILNYSDDKFIIYDPNSYENSNRTWDFDRIKGQTNAFIAIGKS